MDRLAPSVERKMRAQLLVTGVAQFVCELVESALNAKATYVDISVRHVNGSIDLTVTDDGWGVDMHQLTRLCSEPSGDNQQQQQHHGRSRRNMTRSDHVLWAACALSREIEVCSRSVGELTGYRAVFSAENGSVKRFEAIARPNAVGMTILVRGLFDGLPVRKRALRVDREMAQLKRALEAMALRFHHVTFTMSLNAVQQTCIKKLPQSDDLKNTKDGTLLSRFRHVFPTITNLRMYNMELDDGVFHVHGVVSAVSRGGLPTRQLQFVYLDGQWLDRNVMYDCLNKAFQQHVLPSETNRYPAFALFITSPTTLYHMNRGTIQRTVDFRQWAPVVDTFRTLAKHAWDAPEGKRTYERIAVDSSNGGDSSRVSRRTSVSGISAKESVGCGMSKRARSSELALSRDVVMARGGKRSVPRSKSNGADADWLHRVLTTWKNPVFPIAKSLGAITGVSKSSTSNVPSTIRAVPFAKHDVARFTVIGQLANKFILCRVEVRGITAGCPEAARKERATFVMAVDQHAADERVQLEKLWSEACVNDTDRGGAVRATQCTPMQSLAKPVVVHVPTFERVEIIVRDWLPRLERWGMGVSIEDGSADDSNDITPGSTSAFESEGKTGGSAAGTFALTVHAVPRVVYERCRRDHADDRATVRHLLVDYIEEMREGVTVHQCPRALMHLLNSVACRSAIKFGDPLAKERALTLILDLARCKFPFQCAHGRPSMTPLLCITSQSK